MVWDIEMDERNHNKCSYFYETEYIYLTKISKNGREEHWEGLKNITAKRRSMDSFDQLELLLIML